MPEKREDFQDVFLHVKVADAVPTLWYLREISIIELRPLGGLSSSTWMDPTRYVVDDIVGLSFV